MYRIETSMWYDSIVIPPPNAAKGSSDTNHSRFICCDDGSSDKKPLSHEKKLESYIPYIYKLVRKNGDHYNPHF